jgi:ABC-2 type transport system permease protein
VIGSAARQTIFLGKPGGLGVFSWPQMKAYLLVAFLTNSLMTWVDEGSMARDVRMGRIATDLARPIDFQAKRLAEALGPFPVELCSAVLVGAVGAVFGGIAVPPDPAHFTLSVVSTALATLLKFTIVYCVSMTAFWTMGMYGIRIGRAAIQNLFSRALFPLAFFPDWLRTVAAVLPVQWGAGRRSRGPRSARARCLTRATFARGSGWRGVAPPGLAGWACRGGGQSPVGPRPRSAGQ